MERLGPDLYRLTSGGAAAPHLVMGDVTTLVDAGAPGRGPAIQRELDDAGIRIDRRVEHFMPARFAEEVVFPADVPRSPSTLAQRPVQAPGGTTEVRARTPLATCSPHCASPMKPGAVAGTLIAR